MIDPTANLVIALAAASAATTITKAKIFRPLRQAWARRHPGEIKRAFIYCPYCVSHWLVIAAMLVYRPLLIHQVAVVDWFVSTLATIFVATVLAGLVKQLYAFEPDPPVEQAVLDLDAAVHQQWHHTDLRHKLPAPGAHGNWAGSSPTHGRNPSDKQWL